MRKKKAKAELGFRISELGKSKNKAKTFTTETQRHREKQSKSKDTGFPLSRERQIKGAFRDRFKDSPNAGLSPSANR